MCIEKNFLCGLLLFCFNINPKSCSSSVGSLVEENEEEIKLVGALAKFEHTIEDLFELLGVVDSVGHIVVVVRLAHHGPVDGNGVVFFGGGDDGVGDVDVLVVLEGKGHDVGVVDLDDRLGRDFLVEKVPSSDVLLDATLEILHAGLGETTHSSRGLLTSLVGSVLAGVGSSDDHLLLLVGVLGFG